jgi:hypothetical protein
MVTPLQALLLYPFFKTGQWVFNITSSLPPCEEISFIYILHHFDTISLHVLKLIFAGTSIWFIFSVLAGTILYRILLKHFTRDRKTIRIYLSSESEEKPKKISQKSRYGAA